MIDSKFRSELLDIAKDNPIPLILPEPATEDEIAAIAALSGCGVPDEVAAWLRQCNGGSIMTLEVLNTFYLEQIIRDWVSEFMPRSVFFFAAAGSGTEWFLIDTAGEVGGIPGKLYHCERSTLDPDQCYPLDVDFADLLRKAARLEFLPTGESLRILRKEAMLDALKNQPDGWLSAGGRHWQLLDSDGERCGVVLPRMLEVLLRFADAPTFPNAGVSLYSGADLTPVEGSEDDEDYPQLLWFGDSEADGPLAITTNASILPRPDRVVSRDGRVVPLTTAVMRWIRGEPTYASGLEPLA